MKDPYNVIVAGVGGQGNVVGSQLIGAMLVDMGYRVTIGETYGASQRGGSVMSHLRISKARQYGPLIPPRSADLVIALEPSEAARVLGRYGNPLTRNPAEPPTTDYLVCESTYGGRIHPPEDAHQDFMELVRDTVKRKSILLIPAFAIGRTQQVTFLIDRLIEHGLVPDIDIHIDSPMAISATDIYCKYPSMHSIDLHKLGGAGCVLHGKRVHLHRKRKSSKQLNKLKGPAIILSSSGMLTGGRILHHLDRKSVV